MRRMEGSAEVSTWVRGLEERGSQLLEQPPWLLRELGSNFPSFCHRHCLFIACCCSSHRVQPWFGADEARLCAALVAPTKLDFAVWVSKLHLRRSASSREGLAALEQPPLCLAVGQRVLPSFRPCVFPPFRLVVVGFFSPLVAFDKYHARPQQTKTAPRHLKYQLKLGSLRTMSKHQKRAGH